MSAQLRKAKKEGRPICHLKFNLLTASGNTKLDKSSFGDDNFYVAGLSMAPAKSNGTGKNLCGSNSPACTNICLWETGFAQIYPGVNDARIKKALMYLQQQEEFFELLKIDLEKFSKWCWKRQIIPAVRLNVYTDILWELIAPWIFTDFDLVLYDYTKHISRYKKYLRGELPKNYSLIFSRSERENNQKFCREALSAGGNIAAVWKTPEIIPSTYMGYEIVRASESDLWWLGKKSVVGGLKAIGSKAKADTTGFVITE